jgi:hypothetical protein
VIVIDTRAEVVAAYRARRSELVAEARDDERHGRPVAAAKKRDAARVVSRAISDEVIDAWPSGIERPLR